jgi:hypothetical protein
VDRAVQRGHFVRVLSRAGLLSLGTLGVMGGGLVLTRTRMLRRLFMM